MTLYPNTYRILRRHWLYRFVGFLGGILLLYAPFALFTRLILFITKSPLTPDAHRICMRMPIQWLAQPWMYTTMLEQPVYLFSVLVLPVLALFTGPLFCGWICPAGGMTEYLIRLVPPRFQIDLGGKLNPAPVRYGFLVGMMVTSFVGGNVCCSFCNFAHAQNIISAVFGNFIGISYWASFLVISFVLWFVVLGLFTKGGRGWCNLLCPAGAWMGLFHANAPEIGVGRSVKVDASKCTNCGTCISTCSSWAISRQNGSAQVNLHMCNTCMDCIQVCSQEAIAYTRYSRHVVKSQQTTPEISNLPVYVAVVNDD
ncbi:MAG: 4Fe-4S binding protein [Anaerolineales bacterium]|nr:MAG: 4Fe-4S binding protein [Anaerolineales bacterium]